MIMLGRLPICKSPKATRKKAKRQPLPSYSAQTTTFPTTETTEPSPPISHSYFAEFHKNNSQKLFMILDMISINGLGKQRLLGRI